MPRTLSPSYGPTDIQLDISLASQADKTELISSHKLAHPPVLLPLATYSPKMKPGNHTAFPPTLSEAVSQKDRTWEEASFAGVLLRECVPEKGIEAADGAKVGAEWARGSAGDQPHLVPQRAQRTGQCQRHLKGGRPDFCILTLVSHWVQVASVETVVSSPTWDSSCSNKANVSEKRPLWGVSSQHSQQLEDGCTCQVNGT